MQAEVLAKLTRSFSNSPGLPADTVPRTAYRTFNSSASKETGVSLVEMAKRSVVWEICDRGYKSRDGVKGEILGHSGYSIRLSTRF